MAVLGSKTVSALQALADRESAELAAAKRTFSSTVNMPRGLEAATAVSEELAVIAANISTALGTSHPNPSTDNAIARYSGTTGDLQNSGITIDDSDNMALPTAAKLDVDEIEVNGDFVLDCKKAATVNTFSVGNSANTPNGCNMSVDGGVTAQAGVVVAGGNLAVSAGNITLSGTVDGVDVANDPVMKTLYDANTVLAATSDDTPAALTVDADTVIGRITGGNIAAVKGPQVAEVLFGDSFNSWISNNWYNQSPGLDPDVNTTGFTLVTDSVYYYPLWITHRVTFDAFGLHVSTAEAGKNARIAIYNAAANAPTTVVVESGNITLASTGASTVSVTQTTIQAGQYFWAVNADSATAAVRRIQTTSSRAIQSLGRGSAGSSPKCLYTEASAFGAFPATATPGTAASSSNVPMLVLQVT